MVRVKSLKTTVACMEMVDGRSRDSEVRRSAHKGNWMMDGSYINIGKDD